MIVSKCRINEIVHFLFPVFTKVTVDTEIIIAERGDPAHWKTQVILVETLDSFLAENPENLVRLTHEQDDWIASNGDPINIFLKKEQKTLASKIKAKGVALGTIFDINVGIKPYQTGKGTPPQTPAVVKARPFDSGVRTNTKQRRYLRGADIVRYGIFPLKERYIEFGPWLAEPRPAANFDAKEKIFMRQTGDSLVAALDTEQLLCLNNMHVLVPRSPTVDAAYYLSIINSRLLNWYYQTLNPEVGEALAEVKKTNVARLPVIVSKNENLSRLVEKILAAKKAEFVTKDGVKREHAAKQCVALDRQIDSLVYELYGLTDEEIALVEGDAQN